MTIYPYAIAAPVCEALGMTGDQWFQLLRETIGGIGFLIGLFLIFKYLFSGD